MFFLESSKPLLNTEAHTLIHTLHTSIPLTSTLTTHQLPLTSTPPPPSHPPPPHIHSSTPLTHQPLSHPPLPHFNFPPHQPPNPHITWENVQGSTTWRVSPASTCMEYGTNNTISTNYIHSLWPDFLTRGIWQGLKFSKHLYLPCFFMDFSHSQNLVCVLNCTMSIHVQMISNFKLNWSAVY